MSPTWQNTFLTFRLVPADQERWIEQIETVLGRTDNWRDRRVKAAVVLEAIIQSKRVWIHYSRDTRRRKGVWRAPTDTLPPITPNSAGRSCEIGDGDELTPIRIIRAVDGLDELRLVHSHRVRPGKDKQYCSSFMATDRLRSLLSVPRLIERPDDTVWLRDEYGRRKLVSHTPEVSRIRQRRDAHNALVANSEIRLAGYEHDGVRYRVTASGEAWDVYTAGIAGRRIFNEDFENGGRVYGFWPQSVPMRDEPIRRNLMINGEPVIELDYHAHHVRMLYAWVGAKMPADPYVVPSFERSVSKTGMLVILNAKTQRAATQAIVDKLKLKWDTSKRLIAELKAANQPIAQFFHTGVGLRLQRSDSDVIEDAVSLLTEDGAASIPVHDSLIVAKRHRNIAYAAMEAAWRNQFPHAIARIDVK